MDNTAKVIAAINRASDLQIAKMQQLDKVAHRLIKALDANSAALDLQSTIAAQAIDRGRKADDGT